jgi:predicted Zn-dependent protease
MRRHPALTLCGLALGLIGPAATAGPDPNAAISSECQWRNETLKKPIIPPPAPPRPARKYLSQVQTPPEAPRDEAGSANPLEAAVKAEMEKRWAEAERLYREALAKEPDRIDLLLHLVDVLAVQGKRLESAQTLARAADLRPDDSELQLHASEAFGAADRPADAARYNDRALALRPDEQNLLRRRVDLAIWLGDNARAAETLKRLSAANPDDLKLRRDLAKVLGWQGHWDEAAKVLAEYAGGHPDERDALLDLARVQSAAGDSDAAQESLRRYRAAGGRVEVYRGELSLFVSDI